MCTMSVIMDFMIRIKFMGCVKDGILTSLCSAVSNILKLYNARQPL